MIIGWILLVSIFAAIGPDLSVTHPWAGGRVIIICKIPAAENMQDIIYYSHFKP